MTLDAEILSVFLEEAGGYLAVIEDTSAGDEPRREAAHGLKGAAAALGQKRMSRCAGRLEKILRHGPAMELWDEVLLARMLLDQLEDGEDEGEGERERGGQGRGQGPGQGRGRGKVTLEEEWDPDTAQMLRQLFAEEGRDHLDAINAALLKMEARPREAPRDLLDEMLRKAHTLKGSAATVGLNGISRAAHMVEERLVTMKERQLLPDAGVVDRLLGATDVLGEMLEASSAEMAGLLVRLEEALFPAEPGPAPAPEPEREPVPATEDDLPAIEEEPPPPPPEERRHSNERRGGERRGLAEEPTVRVDVTRLDELMNTTSELVIDRTRIERRVEELRDLARELSVVRRDMHGVLSGLIGTMGDAQQEETAALESAVAASASNLDRAITSLDDDSEALRRTTHSLQEHLTHVRMIPIRWLHARLQRPLRQMARDQGKQAELVLHDEATEMDRSVVTQITDSLVQLVRNAVVHGVEAPDQRRAAGKPATGRIEISARHQGDVIFVEVKDDGAGIDPRRIRRQLVQGGEMDREALSELGDEELLDVIFTGGFTTRPEADELSGRGLGLDVVRQNISKLGGDIRVSSEPGRGTRFTIQMPMTKAIAQALLFKAGDQVYAIPVAHVSETRFVEPEDVEEQGELCRLRTPDGWIPLLYLHRVLGHPSPLPLQRRHDPQISQARQPVIVIRLGEVRLGITCSRIVGPRQIVLKGLGSLLAPHPMLAAATISGSNKVQFVLDVAFLARAATLGVSAAPADDAAEPSPRRLVLLVDDSRSVREAVGHILRRAGLAVETSPDGQDAWEKLQLRTYDLLLTDLEMPRLHGADLIARCRQSPALTTLPVVVLSSKTSQANRDAVIRKGADLFLAKPINRRVLVRELRRYL